MNKLIGLLVLLSALFLVGCTSRAEYVPILISTGGSSNGTGSITYVNTTYYTNVTNNITNNITDYLNDSFSCANNDYYITSLNISNGEIEGVCAFDSEGTTYDPSGIYTNVSNLQTYQTNNYLNVTSLQSFRTNVYLNISVLQNEVLTNATKLSTEINDRVSNDSLKQNVVNYKYFSGLDLLSTEACGGIGTSNNDWYGTAINRGISGTWDGSLNHPCLWVFRSGTASNNNRGYNLLSGGFELDGGESTNIIFSKGATTGNLSNVSMGFIDSVTNKPSVDGVYVHINDLNLYAVVRNNNVQTLGSVNYTITADNYYRVNIYIFNTSRAIFSLYNSTDTSGNGNTNLLWNVTINTLLPSTSARIVSHGISAYKEGNSTNQVLLYIDYMDVSLNRTLNR